MPVGIAASLDKVFVGGSIVPTGALTGTVFAGARYSVSGPPGSPYIAEAFATWPPTARNDTTIRTVRGMTYIEATDRLIVTGDLPSAATGLRVVATVCFGKDLQGFFTVLWSRIEEDFAGGEPLYSDQAVAITSVGDMVAVVARSQNYGTGTDMVVHCYDASTGSKTMPSQRWSSSGVQDDVPVGVAIIVANQGPAVVVGGTTPIGDGRSRMVLAAWHAAGGAPWAAGTLLGVGFSTPPAGKSDRATAQASSPIQAQYGVFTALTGVREDLSNPATRDYLTLAAETPCSDEFCAGPSTLALRWASVWDNPLPGQQEDVAVALTIYSVVGGDTLGSYRVSVTGTTQGGSTGNDIHTVTLNGGTGCAEWFNIVNNGVHNLDDFPVAMSSMDVGVEPPPYRRLAITGGTTKTGGNVDVFNVSYDAEREFNASCSLPAVDRSPLWAASPTNWVRPDGDNFDAGIGVHMRAIGGPVSYDRAIFGAVRYSGNNIQDEWVVMRIVP